MSKHLDVDKLKDNHFSLIVKRKEKKNDEC